MNIRSLAEKNKWLIIGFISIFIVALINNRSRAVNHHPLPSPPEMESVDTLIPEGHILVPLELENVEQVSSLIGNSGVIDLYTGGAEVKSRRLIAARVKVIQAPYNPQVYAALIKESDGRVIQNYLGPFRAVVQNPKQSGSRVSQPIKNNFSITYQRSK